MCGRVITIGGGVGSTLSTQASVFLFVTSHLRKANTA